MRQQVGPISIDTIAAERSKFTAPLVLVHGLWCTSSVWHPLMGYLAHRGWDCHGVNLRGRSSGTRLPPPPTTPSAGIIDHLQDLNAVIVSCDAPPVVVGHDLGGLLALSADLAPARAVVAISPLVPLGFRDSPLPGLSNLRARIALRLRGQLPPPRGRVRHGYFGTEPPRRLVAESATLARDLCNPNLEFAIGPVAPTLIVGGDEDAVAPPVVVKRLVDRFNVDLRWITGGSHALPWQQGWQDRATDLHRWLIRTLGEPLLAMLDEEESD